MFSRFLRQKMPFWQVPIVFLLGLGLMYLASLVGVGGRFYIGDTLLLVGISLFFVASTVATFGYLHFAIMNLFHLE